MRVAILGASGFVGKYLSLALQARGDEVTPLSLRDPAKAAAASSGADVVVNLAGASVSQRWTPQHKADIRESRTVAPAKYLAALSTAEQRPGAYVSASAVGYYGTSRTATFIEDSAPGSDFLASVCIAWEAEAHHAASLGMRVACVRTGLVLGTDGGPLPALLPLFRLGLGGPVASGQQWYSWIHIADLVGIYLHAIDGTDGALNATAPNPVKNADFTRSLGRALHRPAVLPVPAFAPALLLGEGAIIATEGQRVLPERTLASGYAFRFPELDGALEDLFAK
jgi:uncharacterized protein (TIGR01777 family)